MAQYKRTNSFEPVGARHVEIYQYLRDCTSAELDRRESLTDSTRLNPPIPAG